MRVGGLLHVTMVSADWNRYPIPHHAGPSVKVICGALELKKAENLYTVLTLQESTAPGFPAPSPLNCIFTKEHKDGTNSI